MSELSGMPDQTLLQHWHNRRDAEAFAELVRRYSGLTYAACLRVLGRSGQAEEVVQECFMALAEGHARKAQCLGAWLHRVATNRSLNRLRGETRRREREVQYAATASHDSASPAWDELQPHVDAAINALPDRLRMPLVMHFLEGKTHQQCAEALGTHRTTVTSQINRGVEQIRESLKRRGLIVAAAMLAEMLASNSATAAPSTLLSSLGKLAISGPPVKAAIGATWIAASIALIGAVAVIAFTRVVPAGDTTAPVSRALANPVAMPGTPPPINRNDTPEAVASVPQVPEMATPTNDQMDSSARRPLRPGMARIHGRVTDRDGNPIEDIQAGARSTMAVAGGSADLTRTDGHYMLDVDPAPDYFVAAVHRDGGHRSAEVVLSDVLAGSEHEVNLMAHAGSVSGVVVDSRGHAVADAQVLAAPALPWHFGLPTARTIRDGSFTVTGLFSGEYAFQIQIGDGEWLATGTSVTIDGDSEQSGVRLVVPDPMGLTIAGVVVDPEGAPIERARIDAHRIPDYGESRSAWSDANGQFVLEDLESAEYLLQTSHRTYSAQGALRVEAGTAGHTVELLPKGGIEGVVLDAATRKPIAMFEIHEAIPASDSHPESVHWQWRRVESPDGVWALSNLRPGDYKLEVRAEGYAPIALNVNVPAGATSSGVEVALPRARLLAGTVVDADGNPIEGAMIFSGALPSEPDRARKVLARSGDGGAFEIAGGPDTALLSVWHFAYAPGSVTVDGNASPIRVVLHDGVTIDGEVTRNGVPIEGARIAVFIDRGESGLEFIDSTRTGVDGAYRIDRIPPRTVSVIITCPATRDDGEELGQRYMRNLDSLESLRLDAAFPSFETLLSITVTESGASRPGLFYTMHQSGDPEQICTGHVSKASTIDISGLAPGEWTLHVYPPGAQGQEQAVSIELVVSEGVPVESVLAY